MQDANEYYAYLKQKNVNETRLHVALVGVVVLNEIAALILYSGGAYLSVFGKTQLDAFALLFLSLHTQGLYVVSIFWGLWLFPFGFLVYRSHFIPWTLGILLVINGFAYLAIGLVSLLLPVYANVVSQTMLLPEALGELSMMIWLLVKGTSVHRPGHESNLPHLL